MENKILFENKGNVGVLILNNPKKLNAFDLDMIKELNEALEKIKKSKIEVVVLKGAGKSFSSGGDIYWERWIGTLNVKESKKQMKFVQEVFSKIETMDQVFIAVIQGYAVGGGNELTMACDIRIALPSAKFIHPETSLGTVAPLGGTKRLPRLIGLGRAKYMLFTGSTIDSKTALEWGLVDFIVPDNQIDPFLDSITGKIASNPGKALALTKKSVNENYLEDLNDKFEVDSYIKCSRTKENRNILKNLLRKKDSTKIS
jgi:enoyl-CoA hydratase